MNTQNMSPQEILELQKKNCIFCKIIAKEIPSHEIYSDDKVLVILDINPANEGHCLVLPKQHYQILPQIPPEIIGYMFQIAKKTSRSLLKSLGIQGTSIFVANGALAGQKAPHFMIHVIPRYRGDLLFKLPKKALDPKVIQKIKKTLTTQKKIETKPIPKPEQKPIEERIESSEEKKEEEIEQKTQDKKNKKDDKNMNIDDIANLFLK